MQVYDNYKIDKSEFGEGPWQDEPDKVVWIDPETNLDCMIVRNASGGLCGYVGVSLESRLAGLDYNDLNVSVHGGLTYGAKCHEPVCHKAEKEVYWFGFDCVHSGDYSPINEKFRKEMNSEIFRQTYEIYRDINYVKEQVTSLAKQIKELE